MAFQSNYCSGRNLTADELQILDLIDNHPYPALQGFGSLGALHSKVTVEIHDECSKVHTVEYSIEELQKENEETKASYDDALANQEWSLLKEIEQKWSFLQKLLSKHKGKSGTIKETVTNDLLGLYDGQIKVVKLFTDNIDKNVACVAMTYVHEMMHAYFDTKSAIEKIEEPIVEYCTLKFLEDFVDKNPNKPSYKNILNDAINSVKREKYALGIAHYGFGHYLYDYPKKNAQKAIDWMSLYKTANNNIGPSKELTEYEEYFNGLYPFSSELECQDLLYRILKYANGAKRVRSPFNIGAKKLGCANCPIPASRLGSISWKSFFDVPTWWYDKASKTFCLNGNFELPSEVFEYYMNKIEEVMENLSHKNQINNLYLGPQFYVKDNTFLNLLIRFVSRKSALKIYVANANKYYSSSNGMLLSKDGKTLLYASGSVVIPQTVEKIADGALRNVTKIALHDDFKRIEDINPDLRQFITVSQNHKTLQIVNGMLLSKDGKTLLYASGSVVIPQTVEIIADGALRSVTEIHLLDNYTRIEAINTSFRHLIKVSQNHQTLQIFNSMLLSKGGNILYSCPKNATNVIVPNGVEVIENRAFADCKSLQSVTLPKSVVAIKDHAFRLCENLASINLPDYLETIGYAAFSYCKSLSSITIPRRVKEIEGQTFRDCTALVDIYLPKGIKLADNAFLNISPNIQYY